MIAEIVKGLLLVSGLIFAALSIITVIGIVLIQLNGGVV